MTQPLALTMGDPSGIGGEISLKSWQALRREDIVFFAIDCPDRLSRLTRLVGGKVAEIEKVSEAAAIFPQALPVLRQKLSKLPQYGKPETANGGAIIGSIERAVALVQAGEASAIITNPINKSLLRKACDFCFPGHTEFLAHLADTKEVAMILVSPELRVVPVTIHIPLAKVSKHLTTRSIITTARITHDTLLKSFFIPTPRIAVAALNPHAGENGLFGDEEERIIMPAISALRAEGMNISGPHPADSMFHEQARSNYDLALCMYHDQALIPQKMLDFSGSVNLTAGLPFIRTSPDHGTAYDLAGTGTACAQSLIAALRLAKELHSGANEPN